ncbi:MAG: deoxyribonuclease IV [Planctomycetes bacterium]|nr:deoxyribonuclease IV [Planctomycetota bacterium]
MTNTGPNIGAHMSIAGGLHLALESGAALGCSSVGLFIKPSNQWKAKPLTEEQVALFRERRAALGIRHAVAHASYLVNLASPVPELLEKSRAGFRIEMERCESVGVDYLVFHPGAHMGAGVESGLDTLAASLDRVHAECAGFRLKVLIEITAGAGTLLGSRFEELAGILDRVAAPERLGVCLDSCHLFAAGYDISNAKGWSAVMDELDAKVGIDRVLAWHANDSKTPLGSHRDRHEAIGKGTVGVEGFRCLMSDARFTDVPKILETPKEGDMDPVNLALLRKLAVGRAPAKRKAAKRR